MFFRRALSLAISALLLTVLCVSAVCDLRCGVAQLPAGAAGCAATSAQQLRGAMDPESCEHCRHTRHSSSTPQPQPLPMSYGLHQPYEKAGSGIALNSPLTPSLLGRVARNGKAQAWGISAYADLALRAAPDIGACLTAARAPAVSTSASPNDLALPLRI